MKNLFFVLVFALGFMSFTSANAMETVETNAIPTEQMEEDAFPCWVRDCVWINGVKYSLLLPIQYSTIIIVIE